jgi:hypothetical protein
MRLGTVLLLTSLVIGASVDGDKTPDGRTAQIVFPQADRMRNKAGSDGSGLCVFTSIEHTGKWQGIPGILGLQQWMTRKQGGGYPEKVDLVVRAYCKEQGIPVPEYVQVQTQDLPLLIEALKSGRMPCITYCISPSGRYGGQKISHMVNLVHGDTDWWGVLDNNYPEQVEWLNTQEFIKAHTFDKHPWFIVFLGSGPPPNLTN